MIEERLRELRKAEALVVLKVMECKNADAEIDARAVIQTEIAADWRAMVEALEAVVEFIENEPEFGYTPDTGWEFGEPLRSVYSGLQATLASVKGESLGTVKGGE
jgi:hypothetical protein